MAGKSPRILSRKEGSHLLDYLRLLLKRLWLIVGIFVIVVGIVGFATIQATPLYRAQAVVNIQQPRAIVGAGDIAGYFESYQFGGLYFQTQYALLSQRSTVLEMVERQDLALWPEFEGLSTSEIVQMLVGTIEVSPRKSTTLVDVAIVSSRAEICHKVCNALIEAFQEIQARRQRTSLEDTLNALETKWTQYQTKVNLVEGEIAELLERYRTDRETFLDEFSHKRARLAEMQTKVDEARTDLARRQPLFDEIAAVLTKADGAGLASLHKHPALQEDSRIVSLETDVLLKERTLVSLLSEYGPNDTKVVAVKDALAEAQTLLAREKDLFLHRYYQDHVALQKTLALYEEMRDRTRDEFRELSALRRQYDGFLADIERYKAESERYFAAWDKLQSSKSDDMKPVTIVERAEAPVSPFKPNKRANMMLGVVLGLLLGIVVAFFLEYMDDTIKTKEELERITDIPLFGVIPNITSRRADVLTRDLYAYQQPKSTVSEAFRGIRTALSYSSQRKENRVYLLTSSGPREGKTTTAINVATVMAYSGTRTVLVDADLRKPRVHQSFSLDNKKGLSTVIIGEADLKSVIQPSGVPGLDVLTSGPIPPNPSELLGRDRMAEILQELRTHYDRVLLDSPPLGAVTDAAVLGRIVDSVILVVHAGRTRRKLIERGLEQLAQINVDVSGIVLNNLKVGRRRYYPGYYHYYYYYSSYYGQADGKGGKARKGGKGDSA